MEKYKLGYDKFTQRLVIPLLHNNKCIGMCRRAIDNNQKPKYLNTSGISKGSFIFGYDNVNIKEKYVLITEGSLDAITMDQFGFNSVALMGSYITNENAHRISQDFDNICLMLDNDHTGRVSQKSIAEKLMLTGANVFDVRYDTDDPGDITNVNQLSEYVAYNLF